MGTKCWLNWSYWRMYKAGMPKNQEDKGKLIKWENFPTIMLIFQQIVPEDHFPSPHKAISACNILEQC